MTQEPGPFFRIAVPVSTALLRQIIAQLDTRINLKKLKDNTRLRDAGADSLDLFNFILAIEERCGIVIPSEDVGQVNTLDGMARYLNEKLS